MENKFKYEILNFFECELADKLIMSWFTDAEYSKYGQYIEKMIHALFDDTRTNGEWFTEKADIIIKKIKNILE